MVDVQISKMSKLSATNLTSVRLLTRMNTRVDVQRPQEFEILPADVTFVRPFVSMAS